MWCVQVCECVTVRALSCNRCPLFPPLQYQKPFSGAWYVKQRLQPTRALGDAYLKYSEFNGVPEQRRKGRHIPPLYTPPYITASPETRVYSIDPERDAKSFLLLACDGVWDVLSNEEAVSFIAQDNGDRASVATRLVNVRSPIIRVLCISSPAQPLYRPLTSRNSHVCPRLIHRVRGLQHVLEKEAAAAHWDVTALKAVPPGRQRRQLHDDITGEHGDWWCR